MRYQESVIDHIYSEIESVASDVVDPDKRIIRHVEPHFHIGEIFPFGMPVFPLLL
jgi:hypothetical protein